MLVDMPEGIDNINDMRERAYESSRVVAPKYRVKANGKEFTVSDVVTNRTGRPTILLYPEDSSKKPTLYYQSKSHGVWRALLAKGHDGWYAKKMFGDENSTDAPLSLQKAFALMQDFASKENLGLYTPVFESFVPTADNPEYSIPAPAVSLAKITMESNNVDSYAIHRTTKRFSKPGVGADFFLPNAKPDFSQELDSWYVNTEFYGRVRVSVVSSKDGKVNYALYEAGADKQLRRWVATAEVSDADITDIGLPTKWPTLNEAVTKPPKDYESIRGEDGELYTDYGELRLQLSPFEKFVVRSIAAHTSKKRPR